MEECGDQHRLRRPFPDLLTVSAGHLSRLQRARYRLAPGTAQQSQWAKRVWELSVEGDGETMKTIIAYMRTAFVGSNCEEEMEFPDTTTTEEIDEAVEAWGHDQAQVETWWKESE